MKKTILVLLVGITFIRCGNHGIDNREEEHADYLDYEAREIAIEEFNHNNFYIRDSLLEYNADYAEEIFFQRYHLKPTIRHYYNQTPCVWPRGGFPRNRITYRQTIDSLLTVVCGPNIYERVKKSADSLKELYPERYSREFITWQPAYIDGEDSLIAKANREIIYPAPAIRDSITGDMRVLIHVDTAGQIDGASVMWGVRRDVDSSALATCLKLGRFYPAFRWGRPQPSDIAVDIKVSPSR